MLANKLMSALSGGAEDKLYVDDVFSAYTYTGNGSTQTINNGIDLAGEGGLVWARARDSASGGHFLSDTVRGINNVLSSNGASGNSAATYYTGVTSSGFGLSSNAVLNGTGGAGFGTSYISWTFRKAPKFFDVVTYTGNGTGSADRQISHALGGNPGMVIVKSTNTVAGQGYAGWYVWHRSATGLLYLNATYAQEAGHPHITAASDTTFTVKNDLNWDTQTYVAYLFAHDTSADGIIQCGSFTTTSGNLINPVTLGWEPQFVLWKQATGPTAWFVADVSRGWDASGNSQQLSPNSSNMESADTAFARPNATGFSGGSAAASATYVYLAIRRPNKPPTTGTEVYNAIARTGTGAATTVTGVGFAPDFGVITGRNLEYAVTWFDRLRGSFRFVISNSAQAELIQGSTLTSFDQDGVSLSNSAYVNESPAPYINYFFRRAPGVFDVVCDDGTATAHAIAHNMTIAPELVIRKSHDVSSQWECWHAGIANTEKLVLNSTAAKATDTTAWNSTSPTPASFTVGTGSNVNMNQAKYVTYLFATKAGISKVGGYTGNGTSRTINCGFTTGARFILIKRTDSTGDWYVWDTACGIVAGNDPHLSLNTQAAEVTTDDSVDPDVSGFIVNQVAATNINVSGGQYIFLAIA